ncbi:Wzz/FepE/Etk N-terminal domain-containing protein [Bacillus sp. MUM 13]|uniref:YveK family protein n=1 Tax=Bacillus sp. MUM 13 TaxID=1678001 RepID=UPI0008F55CAA|nr:Wzz/FepE/Etk N-terminal domain-containing protein [Bacillus sp. MUM 13]OIK09835.1 capsular biosynthesis protein [Bacillus sp. MUM 13]
MEETISLKEIVSVIKKRLGLILVITGLAAVASAAVSYFYLTPVYEATSQILVNENKGISSPYEYNQVQTNLQLVNTYNVIIKSPAVLNKVVSNLNLDGNGKSLGNRITVASAQNTQIMNITVDDPNPVTAAEIANNVAEVFQKQVVSLMKVDNVKILSRAEVSDFPTPVKPRALMNIAIALVVGLMVSVGLTFLLEYLDNTIKTEQDIEKLLELPVLGVITTINDQEDVGSKSERTAKRRGESIGSQKEVI